jgi:hypothetical protein
MRMIGCDLHAAQQTIAMLNRETGEIVERTLPHEGTTVRDHVGSFLSAKTTAEETRQIAVAVARKLGIRLWILLRDQIDYEEFCRRAPAPAASR